MTSKPLVTVNYKHNAASDFVDSFANNNYYLFTANHIDANSAARPFDNEEDTIISCYTGMIFGKRITSADATIMVPRTDWQANTVYDIYDHRNPNLYDAQFYVVVTNGSQYDVFKCLENGNGSPSIVAPSITNVSINNDNFFYPTDGYRWKYMYTISEADYNTFTTDDYIPVHTDVGVSSAATAGSLDVIIVTAAGQGYNNYLTGAFAVGDIRLNGDQKKYGLSVSGAKTVNGYYDGCWLYISSGPGAGQYRLIDSYVSNSTYNYVNLTQQFDDNNRPQNGSLFEIMPSVTITGDGKETAEATARAIVNPQGNTITRVEMIDSGMNYYHASAGVYAASVVGVTQQAGVVPIISPVNGHGFNAERELGGEYAGVSATFNGTEANTIIVNNDYSQVGIIKNPLFDDIQITLTGQNRDFFSGEWVYVVNPTQLAGTISTNLDGNNSPTAVINVNSVTPSSIAQPGMAILMSYANNYQIANITAVGNTYVILDRNALFATGSGQANVYLAGLTSIGKISGFSTGSVTLTDVNGPFSNGDMIIGATTGTYATANVVTITGAIKPFDTYLQVYSYVGSTNQGSFIADEVVYQVDNMSANARFHSTAPDANTGTTRYYFTNQNGIFNSAVIQGQSNQIVGASSGAIATLTNNFLPDLVFASGEVIYIEYDDPVSRSAANSETYQFVFSF